MKDNPMMQYYATIYASSMGVMLLFKFIRGIAFVKVRKSHSLGDFRDLLTWPVEDRNSTCKQCAVKFTERGSLLWSL